MSILQSEFLKKAFERSAKTFAQFYLGYWLFLSGGNVSFDTLFTTDNVEAGIVGLALSLATSIGTKNIGTDQNDPSVI